MTEPLTILWTGVPGTGKSTCLYSMPGVENHIWGSNEEDTAKNFNGRADILPPIKFKWYDCLDEKDKDEMADDKTTDLRIDQIKQKGMSSNIVRYKKYLYKLKRQLEKGERQELKSIGLDNLTPFVDEFKAYINEKYKADIWTREGNWDGRKFWPKFAEELDGLLRMITDLPINVGVTCHIQLSLDEENTAKAMDKDANKLPREWLPNIDGKMRYSVGGIFSYAFFLWAEESAGQATKYLAKLEADENKIGLAKARFQPFSNPRRIEIPKNRFYEFLMENINKGGVK